MTPLRLSLPVVISEQVDATLGDGTVDEVSARLGELGEGEAVAVVSDDGRVYLSIMWFKRGKVQAEWWRVNRDREGDLVIGGPCADPNNEEAREERDLDDELDDEDPHGFHERHPH